MSSPAARRAADAATAKVSYWGKWGIISPKQAEHYFRQAYNRGYAQPVLTHRYALYDESPTFLTFLARRWQYDWLKHVAMRVDAQRLPLTVLRRQIWLARLEYWSRRWYTRKDLKRAAQAEWAYVKERLKQPFTWTGHDILHGFFFFIQVAAGWCLGEVYGRRFWVAYPVAVPEWTPSRPRFVPGFYHVYDMFDDYPFENTKSMITKQFYRSAWYPNSYESYWTPHRQHVGYPHGIMYF